MADDIRLVIGVDDRDLIRTQKEQKKFERNLLIIESAFRKGDITAKRYTAELNKQAKQLSRLGGSYNKANSEVRKYSASLRKATDDQLRMTQATNMAGKSTNRFGMYAQQVGYQVGDFFVQVQSGTSALVAFGQQGTQLAGLLPGVAGAVIGISLAIGTMLLRSFLEMKKATKDASAGFVDYEASLKSAKEETQSMSEELMVLEGNFRSVAHAALDKALRDAEAALNKAETAQIKTRRLSDEAREQGLQVLRDAVQVAQDNLDKHLELNTTLSKTASLEEARLNSVKLFYEYRQRDIDAAKELAKAVEEIKKKQEDLNKKAGEAYFKNEQAIQDAIHQVWVKNNAEQNKKRINDLEAEKKSRRDVGEAYFKQEQENAAAILSQRIKNILAELKAKKDADAAAMAIRRAAGEAYFKQESDIQDQIFQVTIDRIMAEYEATVKAQENAVELRRVAGQAYAREQQQLEDDIHQAVVDRILEEYEAKVKAERDAVNLRREAGLKYAREQQQLEDDIHQVRVDNILNEASLREATISAARAKFKAGAGQFGEASQDVAAQRIAELRKAYADSLKPRKETDLEKLRYQVALETELLGKTEARQKVIQAIGITVDDSFPKTAAGLEQQINKNLELMRVEQQRIDLANTIGSAMETSLMSMVDGTKSVKDAFRDMAADIVRHLYKVLVVQQMINAFGGMLSGSSNASIAKIGGALESYDNGGYTGNGPRSGGLDGKGGFMAIMHPRETVVDHTKGQQANTNGPTIVQNFNFSANGDDSVKKIIAQAAPQIAQMTKNSMLNDRRRGGTTKAVFG